ncbi:hypothetical protein NQ979_004213, partial [Salmonella enterica]|nr:hypothetical protein [Salmonella enterica]
MSENNYGALMLKSALDISVDVTKITSPGIYPIIHGNASVPDASSGLLKVSLTPSKPQITFQKENSSVVYSFVNGNWEKPTATDVDALAKSQNGSDIPDKKQFARTIGAAVAFSGGIAIGGDVNPWTTAEFIVWLESQGAFNHPYWMCKGSWSYAENKVITDTGCGNICLAGAVIEVMGFRGAMTIRVTTPTTTSGGGVASAQFTYINNGGDYSPGWRRDFNTVNKPTAGDVGALPITGGRLNGPLGIGTDNALGGNSIVLGDNDTGFKQDGDG